MKYEVTIKGTLPTILEDGQSEYYYKLACDCTEAIILLATDYAYQSVEAIYNGDGYITVTIRKIITMTEPLKEGRMEYSDRRVLDNELYPALISLTFSDNDQLINTIITQVKQVP